MSAHPRHEASGQLKKRVEYFFTSGRRARAEVAGFAERLAGLGATVVIGGALRDLHLSGNRSFRSDVDFVVDPASIVEFERMMSQMGASRNRFGGYGIRLSRWKVDVWPLERTWAAVAGHVQVAGMADLLGVTFFDWDAILYWVADRRVITTPDYFERLRTRVLEVNLEPNPNPMGSAVRALRYAYRWDAAFGPRLASHVARQVRDHGWPALVSAERANSPSPLLGLLDGDSIVAWLVQETHWRDGITRLPLKPIQGELALLADA